jgi:hypothetical protein
VIESSDLSEGLVLSVQVRQHCLTVASTLVSSIPAALIDGDIPDVVLTYAKRFEKFCENGQVT